MPVPMSPKNGNKNNKGFNWGRFSKTLSFWVFILLIPVVLIQLAGPRSEATTDINYTEYRGQLAANNIKDVTVSAGKNITGNFRNATVIGQKTAKRFTGASTEKSTDPGDWYLHGSLLRKKQRRIVRSLR